MRAGVNDFGGISPVSPDYINPRHPWPHVDALAAACAELGFALRPRLPIYDAWLDRPGFLDPSSARRSRRRGARLADMRFGVTWSKAS